MLGLAHQKALQASGDVSLMRYLRHEKASCSLPALCVLKQEMQHMARRPELSS